MTARPSIGQARDFIARWYQAGLEAVDPERAVSEAVSLDGDLLVIDNSRIHLPPAARVVPLAIGKAALPMARGLIGSLGCRLEPGVILTKDGHADDPPSGWRVFEASHPVPDQRGVDASLAIRDHVSGLSGDDVVIVLVSGGGSALLELPSAPLGLGDVQHVTRLLLQAGAPIQDLNAVRSELSDVKGGGLRRLIGGARCVSVILSDVLGNDPQVIASGPTIARTPDPQRALELLRHHKLIDRVPTLVLSILERDVPWMPIAGDADVFTVVADNDRFLDAMADQARKAQLDVEVVRRRVEGEARDVAGWFVEQASATCADVVIGGGELTVTVVGDGVGGRNTEFALAAALLLERQEHRGMVVASLASDGQDGAIDAAGAIVDDRTVERIRAAGVDPEAALAANDSGSALERSGDLVVPGPTGTNVNDVYVAVCIDSRLKSEDSETS